MNIPRFLEIHKRILIIRETGGMGDILMMRMIFEDVKIQFPECHLTFACPRSFAYLVNDHPYLDEVVYYEIINKSNYMHVYNISDACILYEIHNTVRKHRSDIWANHIGLNLSRHNMHIKLTNKELDYSLNIIKKKPLIYFAPISTDKNRSLNEFQIKELLNLLKDYDVKLVHHKKVYNFETETGLDFSSMKGLMNSSDYVISVDTSHVHLAQGLKKPTVGIFSWTDGKTVGKYHENIEIVQSKLECAGCYKWFACPITKERIKPCISGITSEQIYNGFLNLINKKL